MELNDLKSHFEDDSTTITLLQFTDAGPREVEVELFYKNVLCPGVVQACAQIEREDNNLTKATGYLQACELEIQFDDECVPFSPELLDLPTQEMVVAKIYQPLFAEVHKYDGYTPEEVGVLKQASLYATLRSSRCPESFTASLISNTPPHEIFEQANVIINRRRNAQHK